MSREYWISPSQFAFLWQECKRCWWLKAVGGVRQPFTIPSVFSRMDVLSKDALRGLRLDALGIPGEVISTGRKVKSRLFELSGVLVRIAGEDDLRVRLEDGSIGIYDLKLTTPNDRTAEKYEFQNNAYRFCLEEPEVKSAREVVSRLGLLCLSPARLTRPDFVSVITDDGERLHGPPEGVDRSQWLPEAALMLAAHAIEQRVFADGEILEIMREMAAIIASPRPPDSAPGCSFCEYTRQQIALARRVKAGEFDDALAERLREQQIANEG